MDQSQSLVMRRTLNAETRGFKSHLIHVAYSNPDDPRIKEGKSRHYKKHKDYYVQRAAAKRNEIRTFLQAVKSYPCEDCSGSYPYYVMQLDHRPDEIKLVNPATLVNCGSWGKVIDEIMKCDLVCANCHAIRTFERSNGVSV